MTSAKQNGKGTTRALARPGDPLVTPDGRIIAPDRKVLRTVTEPTIEAQDYRPDIKRTINELPAEPKVMSCCGIVFIYTMMGLTDREIARAIGVKLTDVAMARKHAAYTELFNIVSGEFINANSALLQARIAAYSHSALDTVADVMLDGKHESTRLKAGIDVMDRATNVKSGERGRSDELRITIVEGNDKSVSVELNGNPFGGSNG